MPNCFFPKCFFLFSFFFVPLLKGCGRGWRAKPLHSYPMRQPWPGLDAWPELPYLIRMQWWDEGDEQAAFLPRSVSDMADGGSGQ